MEGGKSTSISWEEEMVEKMKNGTWEEVHLDEKGEEKEVEETEGEEIEEIDVTASKCKHPSVEYRNGSWFVHFMSISPSNIKLDCQSQVLLLLQQRTFLCCLWRKSCK